MEQIYIPQQYYKVLCYCMTYNQSHYIEETLNGFAIQKTDFPYVCLVVDDCSVDGEQSVIRAWIERECDMRTAEFIELDLSKVIIARHKSNEYCTFSIYFLKRNLWKNMEIKDRLVSPWRVHCTYEALCEGDDYWFDENKLKRQHDIMENSNFSICLSRVNTVDKNGGKKSLVIPRKEYKDPIVTLDKVCKEEFGEGNWAFNTSSFFFRTSNYGRIKELVDNLFKKMPYLDMPFLLSNLMISDGYFIDETFGNYRVLSGGYNSSLKANKELSIKNKYLIIEALNDFNKYTNYIYTKYIDSYILRTYRNIEIEKGSPFSIFKPKYLSVLTVRNVLALFLRVLHLK